MKKAVIVSYRPNENKKYENLFLPLESDLVSAEKWNKTTKWKDMFSQWTNELTNKYNKSDTISNASFDVSVIYLASKSSEPSNDYVGYEKTENNWTYQQLSDYINTKSVQDKMTDNYWDIIDDAHQALYDEIMDKLFEQRIKNGIVHPYTQDEVDEIGRQTNMKRYIIFDKDDMDYMVHLVNNAEIRPEALILPENTQDDVELNMNDLSANQSSQDL